MTLPLPVTTIEVREPPRARGTPSREVPAVAAEGCCVAVGVLPGLTSPLSSSCVNSECAFLNAISDDDACFCTFFALPSSRPSRAAELAIPLLLLPVLPLAAVAVLEDARGGAAVCEKMHGLRLHGPPGLLADSSGQRTAANKPSVGNIGYQHGPVNIAAIVKPLVDVVVNTEAMHKCGARKSRKRKRRSSAKDVLRNTSSR